MWQCILNIFERHKLLNKLAARKQFYTATMLEDAIILAYSNRIRQLASTSICFRTRHSPPTQSGVHSATEWGGYTYEPNSHESRALDAPSRGYLEMYGLKHLQLQCTYGNRVISCGFPLHVTSHHYWMECAPNLEHIRVFGSWSWYVLRSHKTKKFDSRVREAMIIGFSFASK